MTDLIVEERLTGTRDGLSQLQRTWRPVGDARSAIVIVHGVGEHSGRYDHVGRYLAGLGHDVLAFDNRGHGQSGGRRGHVDSFDEFLDDVEDLVIERRQLGLPVVLLGHSLGGLICANYLVRGRPKPDLLVLSSPALGAELPRWQRLAAPVLSRLMPTLFVKNDIDGAVLSADSEVGVAYRDDPIRVAGQTAKLGDEVFTRMAETTSAIDRVNVATYVVHGEEDSLVPCRYSRPLAALPDVTYRLWPGLRHECFNEIRRDEVLAELSTWLDDRLKLLADAT